MDEESVDQLRAVTAVHARGWGLLPAEELARLTRHAARPDRGLRLDVGVVDVGGLDHLALDGAGVDVQHVGGGPGPRLRAHGHEPAQQIALGGGGAGRQLLVGPVPRPQQVPLQQVLQLHPDVVRRRRHAVPI